MRESKKINRKTVIYNSALELFGKSGFDNTTILQIADKSGLGVGTLYNYFKSKGDILLSIIKNRSFEYIEELDDIIKNRSDDIFNSASLFLDVYLKSFSLYNKTIWREFIANILSKEPELMKTFYAIDSEYLCKYHEMITKFNEAGIIKKNVNIQNSISTIYSACMFTILKYISDDSMSIKVLKKELLSHTELILKGIIN
jgi:AcrR family transcriptional regulator